VPAAVCVLEEPWLAALAVLAGGVLAAASPGGPAAFAYASGAAVYLSAHAVLSRCGPEPGVLLGLALYTAVFMAVRAALLRRLRGSEEETITF
jgi:membrane protein implicated in regulation of membrane protease activity